MELNKNIFIAAAVCIARVLSFPPTKPDIELNMSFLQCLHALSESSIIVPVDNQYFEALS